LQANFSGTGREGIQFPDSNAKMSHEIKSHIALCVSIKTLEMLICPFHSLFYADGLSSTQQGKLLSVASFI
jgi:hypothetical protein